VKIASSADRASAIDRERLRALSVRSDLRGAIQTGSHFAAIAVAGTALWMLRATLWSAPLFLIQGVLINYLYAGQHEFSHSTVFRARRLNEALGRLFGFILITPRDADQIQHFAHHRHTQIWRQDGELYRARFTLNTYLVRLSGLEYWWSNLQALALYALGVVREPYVKAGDVDRVVREARWHLAGYAAVAAVFVWAQSWAPVLLWLGPMLATKAAHQLQNLIEHVGLPHTDDVFGNTRSVRTNAAMRWLGWNMQYHTAHHAFPSVPCYRLADLHRALFDERGMTPPTMTYLGFQAAVLKALATKGEAEYPDGDVWIGARASDEVPRQGGSHARRTT
jgi:fatty acid desaturase